MKKNNSIFVLLLQLCLFSCNTSKDESAVTFQVSRTDFKDWEGFFKIEDAIPLQESEKSFLSNARKCLVSTSRIVYWDYKVKRVVLFDTEGNLIGDVGGTGHAQSEHSDIKDLYFDKKNDVIRIMDERGIANYSAVDGRYKGREELDFEELGECEGFISVANKYLFFNPRGKHSILSCEGKVTSGLRKSYGPFQKAYNHFYTYTDSLRVISDYGDFYIDSYNKGVLKKRFIINLGEKALPQGRKPTSRNELYQAENGTNYFTSIINSCETSKWLYLRLVGYKNMAYDCFINKDTGQAFTGATDKKSPIGVIDCDRHFFYAIIYPDLLSDDSYIKYFMDNRQVGISDNPIILKLSINDVR